MRDESNSAAIRLDAAQSAAPYVHARLASIEHSGEVTQHYVMALPAIFEKSDDWEQQQPPARPS
jgi:hypothetical protein